MAIGSCCTFKKPTVIFAAFEYNATGAWSFSEGHSPEAFGWNLVKKNGYRGTSNAVVDEKPHFANLYSRCFEAGEQLEDLPPCVALRGRRRSRHGRPRSRLFGRAICRHLRRSSTAIGRSTTDRCACPTSKMPDSWAAWQKRNAPAVSKATPVPLRRTTQDHPHRRTDSARYVLPAGVPRSQQRKTSLPLLQADTRCVIRSVCRPSSASWATGRSGRSSKSPTAINTPAPLASQRRATSVFAMENVGMGPDRDTHHELDRLLRLDGLGWYSLLFAHQQMLLDHVFTDPLVDTKRVGVTGVSTGGLLALSAIAMDGRVAASSVQGIFGSMRVSFIQDRARHCQCGAIPGLLPDFDLPEMALLASTAPAPHLQCHPGRFRPGRGPATNRKDRTSLHRHGWKQAMVHLAPGPPRVRL